MTQSNMGRNGFIQLTDYSHTGKSEQQLKAGIQRQELKQRPWRMLLTGLFPVRMHSLLSHTAQGHLPRVALPRVD